MRDDQLALLEKMVRYLDSLLQQAAGVSSKVQNQSLQVFWLRLFSASESSSLVFSLNLLMWR